MVHFDGNDGLGDVCLLRLSVACVITVLFSDLSSAFGFTYFCSFDI